MVYYKSSKEVQIKKRKGYSQERVPKVKNYEHN